MYDGLDVLENSKTEFVAMVGLYNTIQNVKSIFIPKFESENASRLSITMRKMGHMILATREDMWSLKNPPEQSRSFSVWVDLVRETLTK